MHLRSGEGHNLAVGTGTPARTTNLPSGYSGYSRDFESSENDWLDQADGLDTDINGDPSAITLAAWVRIQSEPASGMGIIGKYNTSSQRQYVLQWDDAPDGFLCRIANTGTSYTTAIGDTNTTAGTWYNVACVYNDTDIRVYVNGSLDDGLGGADNPKSHTTGIFNGTAEFAVGAYHGGGVNRWNGDIDEVIVFDRALQASEINDLYTYGIDGDKGGND